MLYQHANFKQYLNKSLRYDADIGEGFPCIVVRFTSVMEVFTVPHLVFGSLFEAEIRVPIAKGKVKLYAGTHGIIDWVGVQTSVATSGGNFGITSVWNDYIVRSFSLCHMHCK